MSRRVVITGMGIWSCIGKNKEEVQDSLYKGKSGIGLEQARLDYGYQSALTGIVERPKLKGILDRRQRTGMSEESEYAFMASKEAFDEAGISDDYLKENEVGIIFGNDSSAKAVIEAHEIMKEKKDSALVGSGSIFQSMNSTVNMNLSTIFHLKGINMTISAACASGSHSIGLGYMMIKQGLQDMILVGGAQETNYYSMSSFDALGTFSSRMDEPTKASRPFDKNRDGLIPSLRSAVEICFTGSTRCLSAPARWDCGAAHLPISAAGCIRKNRPTPRALWYGGQQTLLTISTEERNSSL